MPSAGIHSVTVPGAVAGWGALRDRFGRLTFAELLAPARFYAEHGFPVAPTWPRAGPCTKRRCRGARRGCHVSAGRPAAASRATIFRNPDLARSLRLVAEGGADAFYRGPIADAILALSRERGGTMAAADLASFEPEWVDARCPPPIAAGPSTSCPRTRRASRR